MKVRVEFERVGRRRDVPDLYVEADNADNLAEKIYTYSRRFLASQDVFVSVDLDTMTGSINASRFGKFTIVSIDSESEN